MASMCSKFLSGSEDSSSGEQLLPGRAGEDLLGIVPQLMGEIGNDGWPIESDAAAVLVQSFRFRLFRGVIDGLQGLSSILRWSAVTAKVNMCWPVAQ